ncbi:hypothetical protein CK203_098327 [Vitis vinifera]|uniref:Uncharacterized protein n=1 Tax=Vitis vinifera TaxID=29760 RepID=A0A438D2K2_VITVI|nr:hypothetical protein CK203_098327 [Vitis vinifera]
MNFTYRRLQFLEPMGDILVFLTGENDIDAAVQLLNEEAQNNGKHSSGTSDF